MRLLYVAPLADAWLHKALREAGHEVRSAASPAAARASLAEQGASLLVLDAGGASAAWLTELPEVPARLWLLPAELAHLRAELLLAGAACLLRPFALAELFACLERLAPGPAAGLSLLHRQRALQVQDQTVELTPQEFRLLDLLLAGPQPMPATTICEALWQADAGTCAEPLKALLHRLRGKLRQQTGEGLIEHVRGQGYCLRSPRQAD